MSLGDITRPVGEITLRAAINAAGGVSGPITVVDGGYGYLAGDTFSTADFTSATGTFPTDANLIVVSTTGPTGAVYSIVPTFNGAGTDGVEDVTGTTQAVSALSTLNGAGEGYINYNKYELGGDITEYPPSGNYVDHNDRPKNSDYVMANDENIPSIKVKMSADQPQMKVQSQTIPYGTGTITIYSEPTIVDYNGNIVGNEFRLEDILDRNRCTRNGGKWDFHDLFYCTSCSETFSSADLVQPGNRCPKCNAEYPDVAKKDVAMFCDYCQWSGFESGLDDFHECPNCSKTWPYLKVVDYITYGAQLGQNVKATYGRCRAPYAWEVMPVTGVVDCPAGYKPYPTSGTCERMIPGDIANETNPTTLAQAKGAGYEWDYIDENAIDLAAPSSIGYFAVGAIGALFPTTTGTKFPMGEIEYVKTMCRQYGYVWNKRTNACEVNAANDGKGNLGNYVVGGTVNSVTFTTLDEVRDACHRDGYTFVGGICYNPNLFGDGQSRQSTSTDSLKFVTPK